MKHHFLILCLFFASLAAAAAVSFTCSSSPRVAQGDKHIVTVTVISGATVNSSIISFEFYNSSAVKVHQSTARADLLAGVHTTVTSSWDVPDSQPLGMYSVKLLAFGDRWTPLYGSMAFCTRFQVVDPVVNASCSRVADVHTGAAVKLGALLNSSKSYTDAIVLFRVYNASGLQVFQGSTSISLSAFSAHSASVTWQVPSAQQPGSHFVKLLVFDANWNSIYRPSYCGSFAVLKATSVPSTKPITQPATTHATTAPATTKPATTQPFTTAPTTTKPPTTHPETTKQTNKPSVDPSGVPMPRGDLPGWKQIFTDDFNISSVTGSFLSTYTNWRAYAEGHPDTHKTGIMSPKTVLSTSNGLLNMYLHTSSDGIHRAAAPYPNIGGLLYGKFVARFRADPVQGFKTAWLLWPDSEVWPRDGEIDFPEGDLDSGIMGFMHRQNGSSGGDQDWFRTGKTYPSWHTVTIEWLPNKLTLDIDGINKTFTSRVPSTSMHWVLQTETAATPPAANATGGGYVQVDWVAVYKPDATLLRAESDQPTQAVHHHSHAVYVVVPIVVVAVVIALVLSATVIILRKRQQTKSYQMM